MKRRLIVATFLVAAGVFLSAHSAYSATQGQEVPAGSPGACKCQLNSVEGASMCAAGLDRPPVYEPTRDACKLYCTASTAAPNEACILDYDPVPNTTPTITAYLGCTNGRWVYGGTNPCPVGTGRCATVQVDQPTAQAMVNDPETAARNLNQACSTADSSSAASSAATPTAASAVPQAQLSGRVTLPNPLKTTDPYVLLGRVIRAILSVIGSITLLMFIYGGTLMLTSAGSSDKVKQGKAILLYSTIGLVIIFSSYIILRYIFGALQGSFTP